MSITRHAGLGVAAALMVCLAASPTSFGNETDAAPSPKARDFGFAVASGANRQQPVKSDADAGHVTFVPELSAAVLGLVGTLMLLVRRRH